jgi:hypothetical protein
VPDFLSRDRKTPGVKASTGMLQIPQESEVNHFDETKAVDQSWFRHFCSCSKMLERPPAQVILKTQQAIAVKQIIVNVLFIARKLIVLDVLPTDSNFNQLHLRTHLLRIWKSQTWIFVVGCQS